MYYSGKKALPYDVVSIQSQVIYGTVGNNAAIPNLHRYGLRTIEVPTVLFSNTPHYPTKYGAAIPMEWFAGFLQSLHDREALLEAKAVILGYLGGAEQALHLADWLKNLKEKYPHIHIGIDPVMGDFDSGLYVKSELAGAYRDNLIAVADLITPNHFELQYLSEQESASEEEVIASARKLIHQHPHLKTVIVTSSPSQNENEICNLIVQENEIARTFHKRVDSEVKGTGDTFHAVLTAKLLQGSALIDAVQTAGDDVVKALTDTINAGVGELFLKR